MTKKFFYILALTILSLLHFGKGVKADNPVTLIRYTYEAGELSRLCDEAIERATAKLNTISALPDETRTFENTVEAIEHTQAEFSETAMPLIFMAYVSPSEDLRTEGFQCEEKAEQFSTNNGLRKDLYNAFEAFQRNMGNDFSSLSAPQRRLIELMARDYRQNGLWLEDESLNKVRELKNRLSSLETEFSKNLVEDTTQITVSKEELAGTSQAFQNRLKQTEDGLYIVTTKPSDYFQFMQTADSEPARKRLYIARANMASPQNAQLLRQAITLRTQIARLLSYETWADVRTDGRMAQRSENVRNFLTSLKEKLAKRNQEEFAALLSLKQQDNPTAQRIELWDRRYYETKLIKRDYAVDDEEVRQYFPAQRVIEGTFAIYSQLFGVEFREVKEASVWNEHVKLFEMRDKETQELIGHFFADLYPRNGKFGHAAAFDLRNGRRLSTGGYQTPIAAMVANINPPSADSPSLMSHQEVETFFHEFGHIMHQTLTKAAYATFSGANVARDFVEAPSQMFENWVWNSDMLEILSGHYEDENRKLPAELRRRLLRLTSANQGIFYTRQIYLALLDLTLHTSGDDVNPVELDYRLREEIMGVPYPAGTEWIGGFGHLMGGYDSGYYGYLWSEVYAQDMFTRFEEQGLLNEEMGMRFRRMILEQGSSKDEAELLRDFLGRDPSPLAFFRKLGIQ